MDDKYHSVTRSFTQKVNPKNNNIPGKDYESVDFFASHSEQIPLDIATPEKIAEVSERLYQTAKAEVEAAVDNYIRSLQMDAGIVVQPNGKEYAQVKDLIIKFETAETKAQVDEATKEVQDMKGQLNDIQLNYLRSIARKASARKLI